MDHSRRWFDFNLHHPVKKAARYPVGLKKKHTEAYGVD